MRRTDWDGGGSSFPEWLSDPVGIRVNGRDLIAHRWWYDCSQNVVPAETETVPVSFAEI